jgi:hypothetical protein
VEPEAAKPPDLHWPFGLADPCTAQRSARPDPGIGRSKNEEMSQMNTLDSCAAGRDQLDARIAAQALAQLLNGLAEAARRLDAADFRIPRAQGERPGSRLSPARSTRRAGPPSSAAARRPPGADLLPPPVVAILQAPVRAAAGSLLIRRQARRSPETNTVSGRNATKKKAVSAREGLLEEQPWTPGARFPEPGRR